VLVVDPSPPSRVATTTLLHAWGCETDFAGDARSALELLNTASPQKTFDVALIDASTPGLSPAEFVHAVQANPALETIELVLLSALKPVDLGRPAVGGRFAQQLAKPVRQSALAAVLARQLARTA
jgi:CheY-like chemotaxis protein